MIITSFSDLYVQYFLATPGSFSRIESPRICVSCCFWLPWSRITISTFMLSSARHTSCFNCSTQSLGWVTITQIFLWLNITHNLSQNCYHWWFVSSLHLKDLHYHVAMHIYMGFTYTFGFTNIVITSLL